MIQGNHHSFMMVTHTRRLSLGIHHQVKWCRQKSTTIHHNRPIQQWNRSNDTGSLHARTGNECMNECSGGQSSSMFGILARVEDWTPSAIHDNDDDNHGNNKKWKNDNIWLVATSILLIIPYLIEPWQMGTGTCKTRNRTVLLTPLHVSYKQLTASAFLLHTPPPFVFGIANLPFSSLLLLPTPSTFRGAVCH